MRLCRLILIGLNVIRQDRYYDGRTGFRNLSDLCLELIELIELEMKEAGFLYKTTRRFVLS